MENIRNIEKSPDFDDIVVFQAQLAYDQQSTKELGNRLMMSIGEEPFWETISLYKKEIRKLAEEAGFEVSDK